MLFIEFSSILSRARKKDHMNAILIIVYNHPEGFPPTLNAINELSKIARNVTVIGRNTDYETWPYPANCKTYYSSRYCDVRSSERKSILVKIKFFIEFLLLIIRQGRLNRYDLIISYDPMGLMAARLAFPFLKGKPLWWYHNHDVFEEDKVRKYSVQWWAGKSEKKSFDRLDIFSLPADERKKHFPLQEFKGKYFFLPNYPSIYFFGKFYKPKRPDRDIRLLFQGAIAEGHGLEEIAGMLNKGFNDKRLQLVVKGWIRDPSFKAKLQAIADGINSLQFIGYGPYKDLPLVTSSCHIGIGIHSMNTNLHTTLGKASNKLYEYAALGLPIIVFDHAHYRFHLEKYKWVFFTDLSEASLGRCIRDIILDYENLSRLAHQDFLNELNFELNFKPVTRYIQNLFYETSDKVN